MIMTHGRLPFLDTVDLDSRPGPPSRLDVHRTKLEHDRMYLNAFEIERLSRPSYDRHLAQQFAELAIANTSPSRFDRIRLVVSNSLVAVADAVRPTDATRRDIAQAR